MGRRLGQIALALLAPLLAWGVAPALSLTPYQPEAVDFEQRLPALERVDAALSAAGVGHGNEGPVRWRSEVIEAPKRFDAVGVAGEMRPLEFSTRSDDGAWSPWLEVANGDPVFAPGSEQVRVRSHSFRPEGKLHYVNVSGDATGIDSALNGARQAVNSAVISASSLFSGTAEAAMDRPDVIKRESWGATQDDGGCKPRADASYGEVKAGVVHHTVNANDYSSSQVRGMVLAICRYHRNGNGWNDIGYNALVDRFGRVVEGREGGLGQAVVGAQAQGYNAQTTGVASLGTHTGSGISGDAMRAFGRWFAWKLDLHGLQAEGRATLTSQGGDTNRYSSGTRVRVALIFAHRKTNSTACPGDVLRAQLDEIRRRAQRRINKYG